MADTSDYDKRTNAPAKTLGIILLLLAILALAIFLIWPRDYEASESGPNPVDLTREEPQNQNIPAEPTNPNVTGGPDAGGTNTSNDQSIEQPSPAGGVDTDGDQVE